MTSVFLVLMLVVLSLVWWDLVYCGTASGLVGLFCGLLGVAGLVRGCSFDGLHSSGFGYVWLGLLADLLCIVGLRCGGWLNRLGSD